MYSWGGFPLPYILFSLLAFTLTPTLKHTDGKLYGKLIYFMMASNFLLFLFLFLFDGSFFLLFSLLLGFFCVYIFSESIFSPDTVMSYFSLFLFDFPFLFLPDILPPPHMGGESELFSLLFSHFLIFLFIDIDNIFPSSTELSSTLNWTWNVLTVHQTELLLYPLRFSARTKATSTFPAAEKEEIMERSFSLIQISRLCAISTNVCLMIFSLFDTIKEDI